MIEEKGGYISLQLSNYSKAQIKEITDDIGMTDIIDDMHITIIYDKSNPDLSPPPVKEEYLAKVSGVARMGDVGSEWEAITLHLHSPDMATLHERLIETGYKHSYNEFVPHLSIKYKPSKADVDLIEQNATRFRAMDLTFNNFNIEMIKE